jgi:glutathione synthase/RimK-type ligase-like ATP-grasp enzyme
MVKFIILSNELQGDHLAWVKACEKYSSLVQYRVVNLVGESWYDDIIKERADYLLAKPGGMVDIYKQLYDERLRILVNESGFKIFPSLEEIQIYENKRYLSFWLMANNIPHPATRVFYIKDEALKFIDEEKYPVVAKLNIGASGNGVTILRTREEAREYINRIFDRGISPRTGPRLSRGKIIPRLIHKLNHPGELRDKIFTYRTILSYPQKGFCIFQEYIPHAYEWRVVRIGESFFAHKKVVKGEKASGSLIKEYDTPPFSLLNFVKEITDRFMFKSQALDIFETGKDRYLVNESQCIFGQSDPYQMMINGIPGRYLFSDGRWIFEEGLFNTNESYDLRLLYLISSLSNGKT